MQQSWIATGYRAEGSETALANTPEFGVVTVTTGRFRRCPPSMLWTHNVSQRASVFLIFEYRWVNPGVASKRRYAIFATANHRQLPLHLITVIQVRCKRFSTSGRH